MLIITIVLLIAYILINDFNIQRNARRAKWADLLLAREIAELKTQLIDEREKLRIQRRLDQRGKPERDKAALDIAAFELKVKETWNRS